MIHADNCSVHINTISEYWLEEHDMLQMPNLFYSLGVAPSDFYLFATMKQKFEAI
jgi:hypothetical protein